MDGRKFLLKSQKNRMTKKLYTVDKKLISLYSYRHILTEIKCL